MIVTATYNIILCSFIIRNLYSHIITPAPSANDDDDGDDDDNYDDDDDGDDGDDGDGDGDNLRHTVVT